MCQLLGMNCNTPTDINFSFSGFSRRAGITDDHSDGWGIAFFEGLPDQKKVFDSTLDNAHQAADKGLRLMVDSLPASQSPIARLVCEYPIRSRNVIAHIRKATQGVVALQNCHPFVRELWGHYWVFAHNGNLVDFHPNLHSHFHPVGDTDSERAFCWLMQEITKSHATMPCVRELHHTLQELVPHIAAHGTFNMLLSNGAALWAHASTHLHYVVRQAPFCVAQLSDDDMQIDFAQHTTTQDRVAVIATQPLTQNEAWQAFDSGQLILFVDGQPVSDT